MNIGARRKGFGMTPAVASAVFRTRASNTSARTRLKRSLPRSPSVSCSVSLSVVRDLDRRGAPDVQLCGAYKGCFPPAPGHHAYSEREQAFHARPPAPYRSTASLQRSDNVRVKLVNTECKRRPVGELPLSRLRVVS